MGEAFLVAATVGLLLAVAAAYLVLWNAAGALTAGRSTPTPVPQLELPKEPWRESWGHLPTSTAKILRLVTDPEELRRASHHTDRLELIAGWYSDEGPKEPLTVTVDRFGRVRLADGHHRLIIAERAGIEVPVEIKVVERIGGWGAPVGPFLVAITKRTPEA